MQIYVAKNQQKHGPFTEAEVRARIAAGEFAETDGGWHDGLANWTPLSQVLPPLPSEPVAATVPPPPLPQKSSGMAKASFIIAMVGVVVWFVLLIIAGLAAHRGVTDSSPLMIILGLFMFAFMAVNLVGVIIGIVALTKSISNKWMAIAGLVVNGLELLGVVFLMVLGMSMK